MRFERLVRGLLPARVLVQEVIFILRFQAFDKARSAQAERKKYSPLHRPVVSSQWIRATFLPLTRAVDPPLGFSLAMTPQALGKRSFRRQASLALASSVVVLLDPLAIRTELQLFARRTGADAPETRQSRASSEAFCPSFHNSAALPTCLAGIVIAATAAAAPTTQPRHVQLPHRFQHVRRLHRRLNKVAALAIATYLCTAFVGPPRDRQPSLWEVPEVPAARVEKQPDDLLAKRVRAVAIGSASGILLSLLVQGLLRSPAPTPVPQQVTGQSLQPVSNGPDLTWIGTLSTGVVIGLSVGFNVGTNQTPPPTSRKEHVENEHEGVSTHKFDVTGEEVSELRKSQRLK